MKTITGCKISPKFLIRHEWRSRYFTKQMCIAYQKIKTIKNFNFNLKCFHRQHSVALHNFLFD
jgi:hypothetical protein